MPEPSPGLIAALLDPALYRPGAAPIRLIETHISWVILAGSHAYKIKKPVNFGFLDFSTLELRQFFCREELRLNRRLASELYLDVVTIRGEPAHPHFGGNGPVLEYAVKLKRFDQAALGDYLVQHGQLSSEHIDRLAATLARFHSETARATAQDHLGLPENLLSVAEHNFDLIQSAPHGEDHIPLAPLLAWTRNEFEHKRSRLIERKRDGFIRECHGDLHLGNLVLIGDHLVPFDCIEFSEDLRWIDVISELAFLFMDLGVHGKPDFAYRLLNRYLAITGDYAGLELLNYYRVYRAMVRAKITHLTWLQSSQETTRQELASRYRAYLSYAFKASHPVNPWLIITHGFSGSGKSKIASRLQESLPAIHLSSDIERKRIAGFAAGGQTRCEVGGGIYTREMTRLTYQHLLSLAGKLLTSGLTVIVDATFLIHAHRQAQQQLAEALGIRFVILAIMAPEPILLQRISQRQVTGTDPSEADIEVLERQQNYAESLTGGEQAFAITVDTSQDWYFDTLLARLQELRAQK